MKFKKNTSTVEEPIFFDIMTREIKFYEDFKSEEKAGEFCGKRNITYLPLKNDKNYVMKYENERFFENKLSEKQIIPTKKRIFDDDVLDLFKESEVLFVFNDKNKLKGVVHFSDYNRDAFFIYGYSLVLRLEKNLRKVLIENGLKNYDMMEYLEKYEKENYKRYKNKKNEENLEKFEPFQTFYLKDLISLVNHKKIMKIDKKVKEFRNKIMHFKNVVENKEYEKNPLIFDINSFERLFKDVKKIKEINKKLEENKSTRFK